MAAESLEILGGNIITAPPGVDAGDESGRRGVGDFGGGHQAPLPARLSEEFVQGDQFLALACLVDLAVGNAHAAAPSAGGSRRIGDQRVLRPHVHDRLPGRGLIDEAKPGERTPTDMFRILIGAGEDSGAHPIDHHVDDAPRGARGQGAILSVGFPRSMGRSTQRSGGERGDGGGRHE